MVLYIDATLFCSIKIDDVRYHPVKCPWVLVVLWRNGLSHARWKNRPSRDGERNI